MKQLLILIFSICILSNKAQASHGAASELTYTWLSDSTYLITYHFYRDCSGIAEPTSVGGCATEEYGGNYTFTLNKDSLLPDGRPNGSELTPSCPSNPNTCNGGTVPGYREWTYSGKFTLPVYSRTWRFSYAETSHNPCLNLILPTSSTEYIETTLDYAHAPHNNSPYFTTKSVPYISNNVAYTYNVGILEKDGDSLYFDCIQPSGGTPCGPASPIYYASGFSLPRNPLACAGTFTFDHSTGQMSFTPDSVGAFSLSIKVSEYRYVSGAWRNIGTSVQDIQVVVVSGSRPTPVITVIDTSLHGATYSAGIINACSGVPFQFSYFIRSSDTASVLAIRDNSTAIGDTTTYTNKFTDSVHGHFVWKSAILDTGLKIFTVNAFDSTCSGAAVITSSSIAIPIRVMPTTNILGADTICPGSSTILTAVGGSSFTWNVLPGGSPASSIGCASCKSTSVSPTVTTTYVVQTTNASCNNKDTFTVVVKPTYAPSVSLNVVPAGIIKPADTVTFTGVLVHCGMKPRYRWFKNSAYTGDSTATYKTTGLLPGDAVKLYVQSNELCGYPDTATATKIILNVENRPFEHAVYIFPNPNTGSFTIKAVVPTSGTTASVEIRNMVGQVVYREEVLIVNNSINSQIQLPPSLSRGVYVFRLRTNNFSYANSLILNK